MIFLSSTSVPVYSRSGNTEIVDYSFDFFSEIAPLEAEKKVLRFRINEYSRRPTLKQLGSVRDRSEITSYTVKRAVE